MGELAAEIVGHSSPDFGLGMRHWRIARYLAHADAGHRNRKDLFLYVRRSTLHSREEHHDEVFGTEVRVATIGVVQQLCFSLPSSDVTAVVELLEGGYIALDQESPPDRILFNLRGKGREFGESWFHSGESAADQRVRVAVTQGNLTFLATEEWVSGRKGRPLLLTSLEPCLGNALKRALEPIEKRKVAQLQ